MRAAAGQVARQAHRALHLLLGFCILLLLAAGILAWRLSQGPIELDFLARAIEATANAEEADSRVEVGRAAIGWEGWREGHLTPIELRLSGVRLRDADGAVRAELPDSAVSLSIPWLLRGELAPGRLELQQPELRLRRAADGSVSVMLDGDRTPAEAPVPVAPGTSPLGELLNEMMRPPSDETPRAALRALRIIGGRVTVEDASLGAVWSLENTTVELRRLSAGGIIGQGSAMLRLGEARVALSFTGEVLGRPAQISFRLALPEVQPMLLAAAAPTLAPLAHLDAPARIEAAGRLEADGTPRLLQATIGAGAGRLALGEGRRITIARLDAALELTPQTARLPWATLRLAGANAPVVNATAEAREEDGRWRGMATLALDQVAFADLPQYWPEGLGSGERRWILENITAGHARNGQWRFEGEAAADLSAFRLTGLSGTLDVAEATVHWLRPIPPIQQVSGQVSFGLPEITARASTGRQSGTALQAREATLRFLFPDGAPPQADFQIGLAGPVPDLLTVLQHPRLKLFERRPLPLKDPQGAVEGRVNLSFPLIDQLPVEQLRVRAQARLREVRLADVLLGRPLERGQFELTADNDGLRVNGTATLAEISARLGVEMDFRQGPATQVTMRETVQARADARALAALGLASEEVMHGPVGLDVRTEHRRNGAGRANIRADLRDTTLTLGPLAWSKPPGQGAGAEAVLRLSGENLEGIESFRIEAPSLLLRGSAAFARGGRLERATISDGQVDASRFAGEARPPAQPGGSWNVVLRGPVLDLRRTMAEESAPQAAAQPGAERGPVLTIDGRFDRVLLGPQRELGMVEARVAVDGRGVVREGQLAGRAGARGGFEVAITPAGAGRSLRVAAEDAGALLRSFGLIRHVEGGRLTVDASYAHNGPGAPLSGTAEMADFSVHNAPGFAKLLQAMTLYGLVEALSGPGLGFSRLIAPFSLTPDTLTLDQARAFSASLGLTAKGNFDRHRNRLQLEGTIVPAYIFNSLLGNLPILGRLFSPETGGGVFAATFRLQGPADDPQVSVNPLAALTPGFLRGLFGIGQAQPQAQQ